VRELTPDMLVIADARRPVALAGVIGGEDTAVTNLTKDVLLESATFSGPSVRQTSRALGLRTEASARFERALPPELALAGARQAAVTKHGRHSRRAWTDGLTTCARFSPGPASRRRGIQRSFPEPGSKSCASPPARCPSPTH